jgi:hypothetical protein
VVIGPALLLGILGAYHHRLWALLLTAWAVVAFTLTEMSMLWDIVSAGSWLRTQRGGHPLLTLVWIASIMLVAVAVSHWKARHGVSTPGFRPFNALPPAVRPALRLLPLVVAAALVAAAMPVWWSRVAPLEDRTNTPFFASLAQGDGLLLTGGELYLVQLRTRRPVLLNGGALDTVVYTPESILAGHRILVDVYGIDLRDPPADAKGGASFPTGRTARTGKRSRRSAGAISAAPTRFRRC